MVTTSGIALAGTDHREADARVAAGGFDHRLAGPKLAAPLGVLDHPEGHPILDRAHGIERLDLHPDVDVRRRERAEAHHRGATDGIEDAVEPGSDDAIVVA
jgi:hypothetical protein